MPADADRDRLERALADAGIQADVLLEEGELSLEGLVETQEAREAADDIARSVLGTGARFQNNLDVESYLPSDMDDLAGDEPQAFPLDEAEDPAEARQIDPDLTDQPILDDPEEAVGPHGGRVADPASEGDEVYVPPTDPVVTLDARGRTQVLGGFSTTSMESMDVDRSTLDNLPGDEALADAVTRELREDAATTDLPIEVFVRAGVVHLRGTVADTVDAENAEAVAARVPGVNDVVEELDVPGL